MNKYIVGQLSLLLAIGGGISPAWAGWGCGYKFPGLAAGQHGSASGFASEQAAREGAMKLCKGSGHRGCHVVACEPNIDTQDQAEALWPLGARAGHCLKNGHVVKSSGSCD
jgi:hypothetical protein